MFICDFHREQSWERWLSEGTNGASAFKSDLLCKFRCIAHASSDRCYKDALAHLVTVEGLESARIESYFIYAEIFASNFAV